VFSNHAAIVVVVALVAPACHRPGPQPAPAPDLPDRIGRFVAGPPTSQGGASRRAYTAGAVRITVTLARFPMTPEQYDDWVRTSTEGYPQATLDVPPGAANGFYQCTDGPRPSCDLLIQLRSGVHIEIRGDGTSTRADVDEIARGLPLRALSATALGGPG
jgi:hypothetical protein